MARLMEKVCILGKMEKHTMESGLMALKMVTEYGKELVESHI